MQRIRVVKVCIRLPSCRWWRWWWRRWSGVWRCDVCRCCVRCCVGRWWWCRVQLRHDLMELLHLLLNGWVCGHHVVVLLHGFWLHGERIDVGHRPASVELLIHLRRWLHCFTWTRLGGLRTVRGAPGSMLLWLLNGISGCQCSTNCQLFNCQAQDTQKLCAGHGK